MSRKKDQPRRTTNRAVVLNEMYGRGRLAEIKGYEIRIRPGPYKVILLVLFDASGREFVTKFASLAQAGALAAALNEAVGVDWVHQLAIKLENSGITRDDLAPEIL